MVEQNKTGFFLSVVILAAGGFCKGECRLAASMVEWKILRPGPRFSDIGI
jgi:hypothetical protein